MNFKSVFTLWLCMATVALAEEPKNLNKLCNKIAQVKTIPFQKSIPVEDLIYNEFIQLREKAIPCLIDNLTNLQIMPDPRQAPKEPVVVGDVALFLLNDITGRFEESFPPEVQKKFKTDGIYAYFEFIDNHPENRKKLQKNWRKWHKANKNIHPLK